MNVQQIAASLGIPPESLVAAIEQIGPKCVLCSNPRQFIGAFYPDRPERDGFGAPAAGKQRVILYGVCGNHDLKQRGVALQIEQALADRIAIGGGK
jgi:hypothetical protein